MAPPHDSPSDTTEASAPSAGEANQALFAGAAEVERYLESQELFPVERDLIARTVKPGDRVVELGCGGGRVTAHLHAAGAVVVATDYNRAMVAEAARRFPHLDIRHGDAREIEAGHASADVVFFSFNGIDYIPDAAGRERCLAEVRRVLRPGGLFVFASHNVKSLPVNVLLDRPASFYVRNWRSFFRAELRLIEIEWGGFDTHYSSVGYYRKLLRAHGFTLLETLGDRALKLPAPVRKALALLGEDYLETWLYYVARK